MPGANRLNKHLWGWRWWPIEVEACRLWPEALPRVWEESHAL